MASFLARRRTFSLANRSCSSLSREEPSLRKCVITWAAAVPSTSCFSARLTAASISWFSLASGVTAGGGGVLAGWLLVDRRLTMVSPRFHKDLMDFDRPFAGARLSFKPTDPAAEAPHSRETGKVTLKMPPGEKWR